MTDPVEKAYEALCRHARETALLTSIDSVLNWDERTQLPEGAGVYRAEQITYLAGMIHSRRIDPQVGDWLSVLEDSPLASDTHSDAGTTIRQIRREYTKQTKLPQSLVEELARTSVLGQQVWVEARKNNDFSAFLPLLKKTYDLKRQQAEAIGYDDHIYDALLDDYEPQATTVQVAKTLSSLKEQLVPLVQQIAESRRRPDSGIIVRNYPISSQKAFGRRAAEAIGFDFNQGRLDITHHPFCATLGPADVRLTTRYDESHFPGAFFGTLHEAGHGIYEQGLRADLFGLPPGEAVSLGIHESQSRLWENIVGRSKPFWKHFYPAAQQAFPEALGDVSLDDFYFSINGVEPSLIRVEADEATYNLHIIIRFELEQVLLSGDLPASDLPGAWNEKYREYLGIEPPNDADGALQDVHWGAGLVGYFPTYALGNLYASQLYEKACTDLGDLDSQLANGDFTPLRTWLNKNIHQPGQCYSAEELSQNITGQPLSHEPLLRYLRGKLEPLYEIG